MNRFTTLTEGMMVVDISKEVEYNYYGFVRFNGEWVILREKTDGTQYRVVMGSSDYESNFSNRSSLVYVLPIKQSN